MLQKFTDLQNCALAATDGEIGKVKELYFDDHEWVVRYVVVDTGGWLTGRKVLLPPSKLGLIDAEKGIIAVHLSKQEIENSPPIESDKPISRQHEEAWSRYYGSATYWVPEAIGVGAVMPPVAPLIDVPPVKEERLDPHLRSTAEVLDYAVHATDGDIGKIEDFLIDDQTWHVRYAVILRSWWAGRKIILSPSWIETFDWEQAKVFVSVSRDTIKDAPIWEGDVPPSRDFENALHRYYGHRAYWSAAA